MNPASFQRPRLSSTVFALLVAVCAWAAPGAAQEDMLVPWGPYWASGPATINGAGGGGGGTITAGTSPCAAYYTAGTTISSNCALEFQATEVVVNNSGSAAMDFRVESVSQTHMVFVDASANAVGIGNSAPTTALYIDSNAANTVAILTFENTAGNCQIFRTDATPEAAVTGSICDTAYDGTNGKLYLKASGNATNTGWTQLTTGTGSVNPGTAPRVAYYSAANTIDSNVALEFQPTETVFNQAASSAMDFRVESGNAPQMFFIDASEDAAFITRTAAVNVGNALTISANTIASLKQALAITGTMSGLAGSQVGNDITMTTTAGLVSDVTGLFVGLTGTYAGSGEGTAISAENSTAGTGTTPISATAANLGIDGVADGATAGTNVGGLFQAENSTGTNYGSISIAEDGGAVLNIGAYGTGNNSTTNIGGMFTLYGGTDTINANVSSALIADNAVASSNIFTARDNGTTTFTIANGGDVTDAPVAGHGGNSLTVTGNTLTSGMSNISAIADLSASAAAASQVGYVYVARAAPGALAVIGSQTFLDNLLYVGTGAAVGALNQNAVTGTGTGGLSGFTLGSIGTGSGNYGEIGMTTGVTATGHNFGNWGAAKGSAVLNVGSEGLALGNATGLGIGTVGAAFTNLAGLGIGGYFTLGPAATIAIPAPVLDTALFVSNSTVAGNIADFRDDTTSVFTVPDGGGWSALKIAANTVAIETVANTGGDYQVFRTDATPEGAVTGSIGDLATDTTNGVLYLKVTGNATNTGWVSQAGGGGTITAGTAPQAAYYSAANTISSTPQLTFQATEAVINEAGSAAIDFRVEGVINSSLFFVDASQESVAITRGAGINPGIALTVTGGTLASGIYNFLSDSTLNAAATAQIANVVQTIAPPGPTFVANMYSVIGGTYVGAGTSVGTASVSTVAGVGTGGFNGLVNFSGTGNANVAQVNNITVSGGGATVGHNIGSWSNGDGSTTLNIGAVNRGGGFSATGATVGIGSYNTADAGSAGFAVGGWFTLMPTSAGIAAPSIASDAVLVADNSTVAAPIFLARDNGTAVVTVADSGDTTIAPVAGHPSHALTITAGTLASTMKALNVTATLSTGATTQFGILNTLTSSTGGGNIVQLGNYTVLNAGYVGTNLNFALGGDNTASGTGTAVVLTQTAGNFGVWGTAVGVTVGANVGVTGQASGSSVTNYGVLGVGRAAAGTNAGVVGVGLTGAGVNVGGYFSLQAAAEPVMTTAALMADNAAVAANIFVARDNGTAVFTIADGGNWTSTQASWTISNDMAVVLSGGVDGLNFDSNTLSIDAANNRVGFGTAAPTSTLHIAGSFSAAQRTVTTTPITVAESDYTIFCDATAAPITINLPTSVGIGGRMYNIKKIDASANACTVDGSGAQTIDTGATYVITVQYFSIAIQSDNANWWVI